MSSVDPNKSSLTDSAFTSGAEVQGGAKIAKFKGKLDEAGEAKRGKLDRLISGAMRTVLRPLAERQADKLEKKIDALNMHRSGDVEFGEEDVVKIEKEIKSLESIPYVKTLYLQNTLKKSLADEKANLANLKKRATTNFNNMKESVGLTRVGKELDALSGEIEKLKSLPEKSAEQTVQLRTLETKYHTKKEAYDADCSELEQKVFGGLVLEMRVSESNIHDLTEAFEGTSTHKEALQLQKEWASVAKELNMEPSTFAGKIDSLNTEISKFAYDLDADDSENQATLDGFAQRINEAIEQFQSLTEKELNKSEVSKQELLTALHEAKHGLETMAKKMDLEPPTTHELAKPADEAVAVESKRSVFKQAAEGLRGLFVSQEIKVIPASKIPKDAKPTPLTQHAAIRFSPYNENITDNSGNVDRTGGIPELGFAYIADATGHNSVAKSSNVHPAWDRFDAKLSGMFSQTEVPVRDALTNEIEAAHRDWEDNVGTASAFSVMMVRETKRAKFVTIENIGDTSVVAVTVRGNQVLSVANVAGPGSPGFTSAMQGTELGGRGIVERQKVDLQLPNDPETKVVFLQMTDGVYEFQSDADEASYVKDKHEDHLESIRKSVQAELEEVGSADKLEAQKIAQKVQDKTLETRDRIRTWDPTVRIGKKLSENEIDDGSVTATII